MMTRKGLLLLTVLAASVSCARLNYFPEGGSQTGLASWYGPDFHGKLTSNKEIYDMYDMTAAHRTLPFGTQVMVTNLENGRAATVRINDRGPFVGDRIIDLSYAAARILGMIGPGTARVRLDIIRAASPPPGSGRWSVQAGSFISKDNASRLARELEKRGYSGVKVSAYKTPAQVYYRVRVGAPGEESVRAIARRLNADGYVVLVLEE
jgi:rare lipoprotein A